MKKIFFLLLLPLTFYVASCGDDSTDDDLTGDDSSNNAKDVSVTSSANVLSYSSVSLKGYANGADGKVGFCYSATNENPDPETCAYVETSSIQSDNSYELTVDGLLPATKYYYRAYATKDLKTVLAKKVMTFTTEEFKRAAVDLGLSVKWANCNVGATAPEKYGDYFAWGETEPQEIYSMSTYKYCKNFTFTKYCISSNGGTVDNKTVLEPEDDAATANWGGDWRMPTDAEQEELRNNCTWTWIAQNGVLGYKVTGSNGNSIFLPAAGYRQESSLGRDGTDGLYWSSSLKTLHSFDSGNAYFLYFVQSSVSRNNGGRFMGIAVRPVCQ